MYCYRPNNNDNKKCNKIVIAGKEIASLQMDKWYISEVIFEERELDTSEGLSKLILTIEKDKNWKPPIVVKSKSKKGEKT